MSDVAPTRPVLRYAKSAGGRMNIEEYMKAICTTIGASMIGDMLSSAHIAHLTNSSHCKEAA